MGKRVKLPGRAESAEMGGIVTGAGEILDDLKGKTQEVINAETDAELVRLDETKQGNLTFDQTPTEDSTNPVTSGGVYAADQMLSQAIEAILLLIPSAASELNKLVDLATMNSSISTATASFKGTYNLVSDLHLTVSATHAQIAAALDALSLDADNNDYAFVQVPNTDTAPTDIAKTERYKFNGENWAYEYDLNNSGFTTAQWNAINSGITTLLVAKLLALPTNEALALALAGKQDNLTFDNAPTAGSNNPVKSSGIYTRNNEIVALINALDAAKQNVLTFDTTPTNGSKNPVTSNGVYLAISLVQTAVVSLDGRMGTAETKISAAETNIVNLQAAYAALTQSDIVVVSGALPSSGQQQNIIYRQPDQDHTPPQFYSDYMWNGTAWVLMATYNNAIDPRPKKGSQNLVTSGGVFDNMGALDVSELNATENPHTLKPYDTLDDALADIPSDYQKGGMSIKYVQTSDNKYVQYRCKTQSFSANPEDWYFDGDETLVDNPQYVNIETDSEDKLLSARKTDGTKVEFSNLEVKKNIINKGLQTQLDSKVIKEDGKSLIDAGFATSQSTIENPEYMSIETDADGKILSGRKTDGTLVENMPTENPGCKTFYIDNSEWAEIKVDDGGRIIEGIKRDGSKYIRNLIKPNKKQLKIQVFGDSLSDDMWGDNRTWVTVLAKLLKENYKINLVNSAVAGSGINHGYSENGRYAEKQYNYVIDLLDDGTLEKDSDAIVLLIGTNDWAWHMEELGQLGDTSKTTMYGCLKYICEKISTETKAVLFLVTPPQRWNYQDRERDVDEYGVPVNLDGYTFTHFCDSIRVSSKFYSMPLIDLNDHLGWNRMNVEHYTVDGLHPNNLGDDRIASVIYNNILKYLNN